MGTVGTIGEDRQPVRPMHFLGAFNETEFPELLPSDFHLESKLPNGARLHEYLFIASDKEIEIAPGLYFPAWTYNGQVPGPTLRATRGDRIRIWFINEGSHPHTIHFHGWHPFEQDGSMLHQFVYPSTGEAMEYPFGPGADPTPWLAMDPIKRRRRGLDIYEFEADPVGLHLYHCHSLPLKRHIHKGLYGTFIVDPPGGRPKIDPHTNQALPADHPLHELVMVMNGFDTNFDGDNEVYAINSVAFHYQVNPIPVRIGDLVRVYLVNITEFDPVNSFHLHAGFFRIYRTGTNLRSDEYSDMAMFCQGERAILEMRFREGWPGKYMFHAHQSEFAELGWMALFDAQEGEVMA
ncbi:MAG: multicopper oxidase domain-containing protein [Planctomycetes bacterium]|nr:multicopper oxidase domain-containing protein [Planctomycetota bacterium]